MDHKNNNGEPMKIFLLAFSLFLSTNVFAHQALDALYEATCQDVAECEWDYSIPSSSVCINYYINRGADWLTCDDNLNITWLQLYDYGLSGEIPPEIGDMPNLLHLDLSQNNLSGEIPSELGNLTKVAELNLSYNMLTGNIPTELANMELLRNLYLEQNMLEGEIPPELASLPNIEEIDLRHNNLTGQPPVELSNVVGLRFAAAGNEFDCPIVDYSSWGDYDEGYMSRPFNCNDRVPGIYLPDDDDSGSLSLYSIFMLLILSILRRKVARIRS